MSKVRVAGFSVSLDGYNAGIEQSLSDPLGKRGVRDGEPDLRAGVRSMAPRRWLQVAWCCLTPAMDILAVLRATSYWLRRWTESKSGVQGAAAARENANPSYPFAAT